MVFQESKRSAGESFNSQSGTNETDESGDLLLDFKGEIYNRVKDEADRRRKPVFHDSFDKSQVAGSVPEARAAVPRNPLDPREVAAGNGLSDLANKCELVGELSATKRWKPQEGQIIVRSRQTIINCGDERCKHFNRDVVFPANVTNAVLSAEQIFFYRQSMCCPIVGTNADLSSEQIMSYR
jgi:hypothetical protein